MLFQQRYRFFYLFLVPGSYCSLPAQKPAIPPGLIDFLSNRFKPVIFWGVVFCLDGTVLSSSRALNKYVGNRRRGRTDRISAAKFFRRQHPRFGDKLLGITYIELARFFGVEEMQRVCFFALLTRAAIEVRALLAETVSE